MRRVRAVSDGAALPEHRALSQSIALAAGIDNDIYSFAREDAVQQKSVLHILMRDHNYTLQQATHAAIALRNRIMYLYARLRDKAAAQGEPTLGRYARDIGHVVRGNLHRSQHTARYRHGLGPQSDISDWTDDATGIDPAPVSLPAISWWWGQL